MKPVLVVVFDLGSASPLDVVRAAGDACRPVFVYDRATPGGRLAEVMGSLAEALDATGREDDDVAGELRRLRPAGITTFSENQIRRTAALASRLGLRYHPPDVAERLTDKGAQRERMRRAGVDDVRFRLLTGPGDLARALAAVPLPAIVKPVHGAGSRDTYRVGDPDEAAAVLAALYSGRASAARRFVLEEMLVGDPGVAGPDFGDYVSVETLFIDGTANHVAVTGRTRLAPPFRETGCFLPATLGPDLRADVAGLAGRACAALGVRDGFTHTEVKLTAAGPRLLEVNGRLGGHVPAVLRRAAGVDPVGLALRAALGAAVPPADVRFDRVAFEYLVAVPVEARRLVSVAGLDEARRVPGVDRLELHLQPGAAVDWRAGTEGYVCSVSGAVTSHEELRRALAQVESRLRIAYEGD